MKLQWQSISQLGDKFSNGVKTIPQNLYSIDRRYLTHCHVKKSLIVTENGKLRPYSS